MFPENHKDDQSPLSSGKKRKNGTTVIAVIIVFIAITAIAWFTAAGASDGGNPGTPSFRDTVENFIEAINVADVRGMFQLIPAELIESFTAQEGIEKRELMELVQQQLDLTHDNMIAKYGEEWSITHEILETRELIDEELLQLQTEYKELEMEISEAMVVDLMLIFNAEDTANNKNTQILLLKIGGSWYITGDFLNVLY